MWLRPEYVLTLHWIAHSEWFYVHFNTIVADSRANTGYLLHLTIKIYYHWPPPRQKLNISNVAKEIPTTNRQPTNNRFSAHAYTYILNFICCDIYIYISLFIWTCSRAFLCAAGKRHRLHHSSEATFAPHSCILQDEMKFIYDTRLFEIIFYVLTRNMVVPVLSLRFLLLFLCEHSFS